MRNYYWFILSFLALTACDNLFEKTVFLEDIHEEQLAVTAILNTQDSSHRIFITTTLSADAVPIYDTIRNAEVILENADMTYRFEFNTLTGYYEYSEVLPFKVGEVWWLSVDSPAFEAIEVAQTVPSYPNDVLIDTSKLERTPTGFSRNEINASLPITFTDVSIDKNYYIIRLSGQGLNSYSSFGELVFEEFEGNLFTVIDNSIVEYNSNPTGTIYLTDNNRDGNTINLDVAFSSFIFDTLNVVEVEFISTTRDHYLYELTTAQFNNSGPFTEPITLYSNTKSGVGIFALQRARSTKIKR